MYTCCGKKVKNSNLANSRTLLWSNPNPTQSFAGQDIVLNDNIQNYDAYEIVYGVESSETARRYSTGYIDVGYNTTLNYAAGISMLRHVQVRYKTDVITVGNGIYYDSFASVGKTNNNYLPPIEIYGIKYFYE